MSNIDVAMETTLQEVKTLVSSLQTKLNATVTCVKSVQRGIITIESNSSSGYASISSVNLSKAIVIYGGSTVGNSSNNYSVYWDVRLVLTSTNVMAYRASNYSVSVTVPFQVIEFA